MFNVRNISLGKVKRHLKFPYRVSLLGYMDNNPPLKNVRQFFPDRLEINIRLNGRENSVMLLDGTEYVCKSPHVVIKKPKTYYEFRSLPDRNVICICYESSLMEDFEKALAKFNKDNTNYDLELQIARGVAIYQKGNKDKVVNLLLDNRVNYICSADYQEGSDLDSLVKLIMQDMNVSYKLLLKQKQQRTRESKRAKTN